MEKKLWYALLCDDDDSDWGTGSFDRETAIERLFKDDYYKLIAVIDAGFDANGKPTEAPFCVDEIRKPEAHPYIVFEEPLYACGDYSTKEYDDLKEAISAANDIWAHLTDAEKQKTRVYVLESVNPDVDAPNHYDGNLVYYPQEFAIKIRTHAWPSALEIKVDTNHGNIINYSVGLDSYCDDADFCENIDFESSQIIDELESSKITISDELTDEIRTAIKNYFDAHNCGENN